jgi:hypothetical protein
MESQHRANEAITGPSSPESRTPATMYLLSLALDHPLFSASPQPSFLPGFLPQERLQATHDVIRLQTARAEYQRRCQESENLEVEQEREDDRSEARMWKHAFLLSGEYNRTMANFNCQTMFGCSIVPQVPVLALASCLLPTHRPLSEPLVSAQEAAHKSSTGTRDTIEYPNIVWQLNLAIVRLYSPLMTNACVHILGFLRSPSRSSSPASRSSSWHLR